MSSASHTRTAERSDLGWIDVAICPQASATRGQHWPMTAHQHKALEGFCTAVREHKDIRSDIVLVFGSAARGRALPFSDIDVAVVSSFFSNVPWSHRLKILKAIRSAGSPISPIGVTETEIERGENAYPSVLRSLAKGRCRAAATLLTA